jgi:MarR family transcriptional regulator, organic hydroperoxide resistance regulator
MATPEELTLDDQLCFALYGANMAIQRAYKPLLDELGITYPQFLVLSSLWEADGQTVGVIARRLDLESSTITPLLKRLEQAGLVRRERQLDDERQVSVRLTDAGHAMRERSLCLPMRLFEAAGMTPERLVALLAEVKAFRTSVASFGRPA